MKTKTCDSTRELTCLHMDSWVRRLLSRRLDSVLRFHFNTFTAENVRLYTRKSNQHRHNDLSFSPGFHSVVQITPRKFLTFAKYVHRAMRVSMWQTAQYISHFKRLHKMYPKNQRSQNQNQSLHLEKETRPNEKNKEPRLTVQVTDLIRLDHRCRSGEDVQRTLHLAPVLQFATASYSQC